MKVLSVAWKIYDDRLQEFCNNCTGAGLVIKNLCEYIGRIHESYLFVGCVKLPGLELGNIHIVDTASYFNEKNKCVDSKERHLELMIQAFEKAINEIKPDIVNFHGIGELMQYCLEICEKKCVPYVYTEHLFIQLDSPFNGYERNINWEKQVYTIPNLKIITVSTGMKKKIIHNFPQISSKNVYVIKNGTDFLAIQKESNIRQRHGLNNKKVLLCVGSINDRKNQRQVIRAFRLLPSFVQDNVKVIFCGNDALKGQLQVDIEKAGLQDKLIYVGAVNSEEMKKYYSVADGLIMPSYSEGLSIAALEAITYGLPVILFEDSECADDLNDREVACYAEERTDLCLAETIVRWKNKRWNREYIIRYSKQFSMERMAQEYIRLYQYILDM